MGSGVAVSHFMGEPTEDGTGSVFSSKKSWLCGRALGLLQNQALAQQPFVLRLHYMSCCIPWVFLHSSSRCGETVPQDSVVNGRNVGMAILCQPEAVHYLPVLFHPSQVFLSSCCLLPFLKPARENCSTRKQVTRRDEWGQLLLTTPAVSRSLAKHLGVPRTLLGVPLEEEVSERE